MRYFARSEYGVSVHVCGSSSSCKLNTNDSRCCRTCVALEAATCTKY